MIESIELHLRVIGILLIGLSMAHVVFPKYFEWKKDLSSLSLINREMMVIHTFFIALTVLLMGVLCLTNATELIETKLGKTVSLGFGIFWTSRLLIQFFGYSSELWKGKKFETTVHILFSILWLYLGVIFWAIYLN